MVALADHPTWYPRVWSRVAEEVSAGRQAFVVTSAISSSVREEGELEEEESEGTPTIPRASVEDTLPMIRNLPEFASLKVEAIHGQIADRRQRPGHAGFCRR